MEKKHNSCKTMKDKLKQSASFTEHITKVTLKLLCDGNMVDADSQSS